MADTKFSALTAATSVADADTLPIVQSATSKRATFAMIKTWLGFASNLLGVAAGGTGVGTLTGLVKGNGTSAFSAATAGTDYVAPGGALGTPSSGTLTNATGLPIVGGTTGTLSVARGGTGGTTANAARVAVNQGKATLTDGATVTPDFSTGNYFTLATTQSFTLANGTNPADGATYVIKVKQDATGSRTITWGSKYKFPGGSAATLSTAANAIDTICMVYDSADDIYMVVVNKGFA